MENTLKSHIRCLIILNVSVSSRNGDYSKFGDLRWKTFKESISSWRNFDEAYFIWRHGIEMAMIEMCMIQNLTTVKTI